MARLSWSGRQAPRLPGSAAPAVAGVGPPSSSPGLVVPTSSSTVTLVCFAAESPCDAHPPPPPPRCPHSRCREVMGRPAGLCGFQYFGHTHRSQSPSVLSVKRSEAPQMAWSWAPAGAPLTCVCAAGAWRPASGSRWACSGRRRTRRTSRTSWTSPLRPQPITRHQVSAAFPRTVMGAGGSEGAPRDPALSGAPRQRSALPADAAWVWPWVGEGDASRGAVAGASAFYTRSFCNFI